MSEMEREVKKEFETIVGKDGVVHERRRQKELLGGTPHRDSLLLLPSKHEEIAEILKKASSFKIPVWTSYYGKFEKRCFENPGIFLLFSRMGEIENLDVKNLVAHVQRGVTFEKLQSALKEHTQKILPPAAAYTDSVLEAYVNRSVQFAQNRYQELQFTNLYAVLPSGEIYKTGSHVLSEKIADWKDEPGPHLCKIYHGGEDIFGVVSRASVQTFPLLERREVRTFHFFEFEKGMEFLKWISRKELVQEGVIVNAVEWRSFTESPGFEGWVVICGFESFAKHVDYQVRKVKEKAVESGGIHMEDADAAGLKYIETPGRADIEDTVEFFSLFRDISFFDRVVDEIAGQHDIDPKSLRRVYISCSTGRCIYEKCRLPAKDGEVVKKIYSALLKSGAFVDRLIDGVAEEYYRNTSIPPLIKKLKDAIDPFRVLNPGRFVEV